MRRKREDEHYVNNKEFSQAVVDYVTSVNEARATKTKEPIVTHYIGTCFLRISEGLSRKPNFSGYSYREEMVGDAVENCLKAVMNYNVKAATRSGKPNAFAYFTQIVYYAFLRRIAKEKKQQDIKVRFREHCGVDDLMDTNDAVGDSGYESGFIEQIKSKTIRKNQVEELDGLSEKKGIESFMK